MHEEELQKTELEQTLVTEEDEAAAPVMDAAVSDKIPAEEAVPVATADRAATSWLYYAVGLIIVIIALDAVIRTIGAQLFWSASPISSGTALRLAAIAARS